MIVVERPAYSSEELYLAYRKAKTYAYRDTNAPYGNAFAKYEADLANKLSKLRARLNGRGPLDDEDFLGTWTALPKALAMPSRRHRSAPP